MIEDGLVRPEHHGGNDTGEVLLRLRGVNVGHLNLRIFTDPGVRGKNLIINSFDGAGGVQWGMICLLVQVIVERMGSRVLRESLADDLTYQLVTEAGYADLSTWNRRGF